MFKAVFLLYLHRPMPRSHEEVSSTVGRALRMPRPLYTWPLHGRYMAMF